jgi:hypothetical protein
VAIDRSGAEAVENRHAVEKPSSPPPDRPGAEGFPSRAESRAAAAADQRQHSDRAAERPAPSAEEHDATPEENTESAADQDDGERPAREDGASDSPDEADHEPPGSLTTDLPGSQDVRDEPATTDRQQARDGVAPPHDEVGTAGSERSSLEQQYSLEEPRLDDPPAREDLEPASVPAETAAAHTATGHGQEADTAEPPLGVAAETAEDHYVQDQRSRTDQPETETPPAADNPDQGNSEPAVDATELAEPTGPAEDQGVEARSDDTVDNGDTAEPSGALDQPADVDKDTLDTDITARSSQPRSSRPWSADSPEAARTPT